MYSSDDDNIETVDIDQDLDLLAAEVEEKNYVPPRPRTPSPLRVRTPSPPPLAQPYFQSALNPHIWGDVRRDFTSYAIPHTRSYSMPSILFQSPPPSQSFIAPTNIDDEMVFDSIVDAAHDDDIKEFKYAVENTSFMEDDLFIAILSTLLEDLNSDSKYILLFLGAFSDYVITTINTTFTCIVKSQRIDLLDYFISAFSQHKPKDWFWYNINRKWYLNSASEEFKNHLNNYFPFEQYFISGKEKIHPPSSSTLYAYGDCSNSRQI
jgi:hypothetical protein